MHEDLKIHDSVLEQWDYKSYERWEPPSEENEAYLNCDEWLEEDPLYQHLEENIENLVDQAIATVDQQF